jgi:hypothetical protein
LRVLHKPQTLEAVDAELARLDAPDRTSVIDQSRTSVSGDGHTSERSARRLAYALARSWMGGLLREAGLAGQVTGGGAGDHARCLNDLIDGDPFIR